RERRAPDGVIRVSEDEIFQCDAIFICVAISAFEEVIKKIAERIRPNATVIDTCSVKVFPIRAMEKNLPAGINIIGTHPMFGPDSGKNGIEDLPLVFCPVNASADINEYWKSVFVSFGLSVHELSPEYHDREAAYTQGITHFMGRVLGDLELEKSPIGTLGYKKLLEIVEQTCNDPFQLFIDLQKYNPYTDEMRSKLAESLQKVQSKLSESLDS
ncbi:unnamed protein product, partial [marine sediment metagenome]